MNTHLRMEPTLNIIQIFASADWGGGEKYAYDLSRELIRHGHRVCIVSRPSSIISSKAADSGISHMPLPLKGFLDLRSALRLARILRIERADIIHVHNFKDAFTAAYASKLCGSRCRIVLTRHLVKKGKSSLPFRGLYKSLDAMVFVSELARREFLSTAPAQAASKTEVIYNSSAIAGHTPHSGSEPEDLRAKFGIGNDTFLVGFTGRVAPEKGPEILIQAVGLTTEVDTAAVFIGSGDSAYVERLQKAAHECGACDRIFFYGYADNVQELIRQVDAGVAPSTAREAFCLSAIEYMREGKPVVTTDNGAQREYIVPGENGLLVPPSSPDDLAAAIRTLATDRELRERLGAEGKRTFDRSFRYDTFYRRMMQVYLRVCNAGEIKEPPAYDTSAH